MNIKKWGVALAFGLVGTGIANSQERQTEICIDFRVNSTVIDSAFADNASRLQEMVELLRDIRQDSTVNIIEVSFCGAASPEGSYQLNRKLAQGRLAALEQFIRREVDIPDSLITYNESYIPWNYLKSQIEDSGLTHKDEVISILGQESRLVDYHHPDTHIDDRIVKLKALDDGAVWRQLDRLFFEQMRNACAVFITYKKELSPEPETGIVADDIKTEQMDVNTGMLPDSAAVMDIHAHVVDGWYRKLHLKTNAIGLGLAVANVAAEIDLARHWSVTLPVYYSGWDYFKPTVKFRTLAVQPEIRYWLSDKNDGFFGGAHFGLAYYNIAVGGDYRYQDHNRETPAIGGGVSVGYRRIISKDDRWRMEFSIGGGAYSNHYDKFHNTPDVKDGLRIESINKVYLGVDQVSVSVAYSFGWKKEGGIR